MGCAKGTDPAGPPPVVTTTPKPGPFVVPVSDCPLEEFYVYRAQNRNTAWTLENINFANADGVMWYIHNEIIPDKCPRKFDVTQILRLRVKVRNTQALCDQGIHWGVRVAYDSGQCTGPHCEMYQTYG